MVRHPHEEPAGGEQVEVVDDEHGGEAPDEVAQVAAQDGRPPTESEREVVNFRLVFQSRFLNDL